MRNLWTIFKKEIYRVLSDGRLVVMIFILPGLSIFIMYSLMGSLIANQMNNVIEHKIVLYETNIPSDLKTMLKTKDSEGKPVLNITFKSLEEIDFQTMEKMLRDGDIDIVLDFDEDFSLKAENDEKPELRVYYNYGEPTSSYAYSQIMNMISAYNEYLLIEKGIDNVIFLIAEPVSFHDDTLMAGRAMAMLMPMLIVIFLFAGAMSIGPDAIAGEKERGTIATLLVTPIKRSEIAIGKVMSLAVLALMSALSSFIGIVLSLPKLMNIEQGSTDLGVYGVFDYLIILIILMSTVLFIVGLIAVISAYAKTIKEASMLIMPFYFVTLIVGIMTSFGSDPQQLLWVHAIPIYGAVNLLAAVFVFDWSLLNFLMVCISSVFYTLILIWILGKMFNSEKIMFQK